MTNRHVGTREEWLAARRELLEREKELTRRSDELARERQELPWVPVEEEYRFETSDGTRTLAELFDVSALGTDFNLDFALFTEEERRTGKGFNFGTPRVAHAAPPLGLRARRCGGAELVTIAPRFT